MSSSEQNKNYFLKKEKKQQQSTLPSNPAIRAAQASQTMLTQVPTSSQGAVPSLCAARWHVRSCQANCSLTPGCTPRAQVLPQQCW